jgi:hypothetical protein
LETEKVEHVPTISEAVGKNTHPTVAFEIVGDKVHFWYNVQSSEAALQLVLRSLPVFMEIVTTGLKQQEKKQEVFVPGPQIIQARS